MKVVYHSAAMGNWQDVVADQFELLSAVGLTQVDATHVGNGSVWLKDQAIRQGITLDLVATSTNLQQYETPAMVHIEQLAKRTDEPILYFHTKGVSVPGHRGKQKWRSLMEQYVICDWQDNVRHLETHDAIGVNWIAGKHPHFSGNFWVARADWIRKLPDFKRYDREVGRRVRPKRCTCEFWIGAAAGCRYKSLVCSSEPFWATDYKFDKFPDPV